MRRQLFLFLIALVAVSLVGHSEVQADFTVGSSSVVSPQGDFGGNFALENIINQSGLSDNYSSGITDFTTYAATTTHDGSGSLNSGFTNTVGPPGQFSFDLGAEWAIDGLAFWDTNNIGSVTSFDLYTDDDQNFANGGVNFVGTFSPTGNGTQPQNAQIFGFQTVTTQYFHIDALDMAGGTPLVPGIGEVVWRSSTAIPDPSMTTIAGLAILGICGRRPGRQKKQTAQ